MHPGSQNRDNHMAHYDGVFNALGLRDWCDAGTDDGPMTMAQLLAKTQGAADTETTGPLPFPSLDSLHEACSQIPQTREMTAGLERFFLDIKDNLKLVLDPITQPLSWALDGALWLFTSIPWWVLVPLLIALTWWVSRSKPVTAFVAVAFAFLGFIDHLEVAIQTLSIIFVCTGLCVLIGVPIGIAMSKSDRLQKTGIPVLDLLQTLPTFVYLIPAVAFFSVGQAPGVIATVIFALPPVVRLTALGIRQVPESVTEAANAFGATGAQLLFKVELPLAVPSIRLGVNQTIMMCLSMVVVAAMIGSGGLGLDVIRSLQMLQTGRGLLAGLAIVFCAMMLDRMLRGRERKSARKGA